MPVPACLSILLVALVLSPHRDARAQAWAQKPGSGYVKIAYGLAAASDQYSFDGRRKPYVDGVDGNAYFVEAVYAYLEYGLARRLTLVTNWSYKRVRVKDAAFRYRTYGSGPASIGLRYNFASGTNALSASLGAAVPTGYVRNHAPSIGTGQLDAVLLLAYGRSLYPLPAYLQLGAGYRYRSPWYVLSRSVPCRESIDIHCVRDMQPLFEDELLFSAETGIIAKHRVLLQLLGQGVWSVRAPDTGFSITNPFPTRQGYMKVGSGVTALLPENAGLSLQAFVVPYGRNTVRSLEVLLGVDVRF